MWKFCFLQINDLLTKFLFSYYTNTWTTLSCQLFLYHDVCLQAVRFDLKTIVRLFLLIVYTNVINNHINPIIYRKQYKKFLVGTTMRRWVTPELKRSLRCEKVDQRGLQHDIKVVQSWLAKLKVLWAEWLSNKALRGLTTFLRLIWDCSYVCLHP